MIEDIVGETDHEVSRGVGDDGFGGKVTSDREVKKVEDLVVLSDREVKPE